MSAPIASLMYTKPRATCVRRCPTYFTKKPEKSSPWTKRVRPSGVAWHLKSEYEWHYHVGYAAKAAGAHVLHISSDYWHERMTRLCERINSLAPMRELGDVVLGTVDRYWRIDRVSQDVTPLLGLTRPMLRTQ